MELLSQHHYQTSTESYAAPLYKPDVNSLFSDYLSRFFKTVVAESYKSHFYRDRVFAFGSIDFLSRYSETETSVFLKNLNDIKQLENLYLFNNPVDIRRFLLTHNYLIDPLYEVYDQIRRIFGESIVQIRLEHDRDPEEDFEGLFITIETNLPVSQSLDLLERFDEEWWLDVDNEVREVMTIMV